MTRSKMSVLTTLSVVFCSAVASPEDATLAQIMKAHVEAVGGVDNIHKVVSMHRSGKATMDGIIGHMEGTFEEISIIERKAYSKMDLVAFMQRSGWDGQIGWAEDAMLGLRDIEGDELELLKNQARVDTLATVWMLSGANGFSPLPAETHDGREFHVVEIVGVDGATYYIDPDDHHVRRIKLDYNDPQMGPSTIIVKFDKYTQFDGVMLPNQVAVDIADGTIEVVYDYEKTVLNGEIDETVFNKP